MTSRARSGRRQRGRSPGSRRCGNGRTAAHWVAVGCVERVGNGRDGGGRAASAIPPALQTTRCALPCSALLARSLAGTPNAASLQQPAALLTCKLSMQQMRTGRGGSPLAYLIHAAADGRQGGYPQGQAEKVGDGAGQVGNLGPPLGELHPEPTGGQRAHVGCTAQRHTQELLLSCSAVKAPCPGAA